MKKAIKPIFSDILRQERKKLGLTQSKLAEKVGVDSQTVGRWEEGKLNHFLTAGQSCVKFFI